MFDLDQLQKQFSQEIERLNDEGGSILTGRLFSLLMFSPKPLSLQEMADQLGVTKAAVSIRVKELESSGLTVKMSNVSDRRDYHYIADDFGLVLMETFLAKMNQFAASAERILIHWPDEEDVSEDQLETYHIAKKRMKDYRLIYDLVSKRLEGIGEEWMEKRKEHEREV